jgi:hypothetical protein
VEEEPVAEFGVRAQIRLAKVQDQPLTATTGDLALQARRVHLFDAARGQRL